VDEAGCEGQCRYERYHRGLLNRPKKQRDPGYALLESRWALCTA
jgi:hypothetical protein